MKTQEKLKSISIFALATLLFLTLLFSNFQKTEETSKIKATVLYTENGTTTIMDDNRVIYTLAFFNDTIKSGDYLSLEYTGIIDQNLKTQEIEVISYVNETIQKDENGIPTTWLDHGIFEKYYVMAIRKLQELSLDEKIGQVLLARYPTNFNVENLQKFPVSGFVFYEKDFRNKTKEEVEKMMNTLQKNTKFPLLTAVDEEGGSVVRISSNPSLAAKPFSSAQALYQVGGLSAIKKDTKEKSALLESLGINLNLAPVVDVSENPSNYIYPRTLGENALKTAEYAKAVIESSKATGVSYTLKHFPGYGTNENTHTGVVVDTRDYDDIMNQDLLPFESGIKAGAEAVLVGHQIVNAFDGTNPASLSFAVHNLLTDTLQFTGVSITDDLSMQALASITNTTKKALLAGNDLIITSDYETSFQELKKSVEDGEIDEMVIEQHAFKVLAWKYYKGLMLVQTK